jgi:hypothetical protein
MPTQATAPARPTRTPADTHAPAAEHFGTLEAWLCALLTALLWRMEPISHLFPKNGCYPTDDLDEEDHRYIRAVLRAANRLRAWIGWILRFDPNRGMRRTFARLAPKAPLRPPRARPHNTQNPPKHPASRGDDSWKESKAVLF